jgi:hypothetical protein
MTNFTVEQVRERIATSTLSVEKAIVALHARQTADEQAAKVTGHDNGMGFTGADAFILSSFAEWIGKSWKQPGQKLSDKQLLIARKKLPKYAGQLLKIYKAQHPA